tara:strand:- start:238 stop:552 length:315 start_codon:yes stop_codon:yes gene_type:complete
MYETEDYIKDLGIDNSEPKLEDMYLVNSIFQPDNEKTITKAVSGLKDILIAALLFAILSLPVVDKTLCAALSSITSNRFICYAAKILVFAILLFFITNYALSRF